MWIFVPEMKSQHLCLYYLGKFSTRPDKRSPPRVSVYKNFGMIAGGTGKAFASISSGSVLELDRCYI